jgi:exosortase E/protease (VPEID-CTERM system)
VSEASSGSRVSPMQVRLGVAGVVLLLEYLAISFAFDAQTVAARGGVWVVLGEMGRVGPLLAVAATAYLLLPSATVGDAQPQLSARPNIALLGLHVLLALAFAALTRTAFGTDEPPRGPALLWLLTWAALGCATAASLFIGVVGEWRWLGRTLSRAAAAGGLLGLAGWLAGSLSTELWAPLSYATFVTVTMLLRGLSFDLEVYAEERVLELDEFAISVAPVCSGFEGIGLFTVLMAGFLYVFRSTLRFPHALLLLPLGMAAVWFGNAVRIAALMILGARVDPGLAIGSFHSKAGWVFFCAITLAVAALGRNIPFFTREKPRAENAVQAFENPTAPLLLPLLIWTGMGLVTSSFADAHDPLYSLRVLGAGGVLFYFRDSYREWLQRPTWPSWLVGAAVGMAWLLPLPGAPTAADAATPIPDASDPVYFAWVAARVCGAVAIIPLCEELAFRGYFLRWLTRREFWEVSLQKVSFLSIALTSFAFGLIHSRWLAGALTGVVYALLVRRSGKLADGIVAHAMSNLVIAVWVLATGNFQHW